MREMGDMTIAVYDAWGNPQFEADGSRKFNPDKLGQYPSVGYRQCPLRCPGPYCTKEHYEINEAARKDVLNGTFDDQEEETPECALETARTKTQVLLLPVEGRDDLCMLVEAKVPFTKRGMPTGYINNHDKSFKGLFPITHKLKSMGFSWDYDKSITGGKCRFAQRPHRVRVDAAIRRARTVRSSSSPRPRPTRMAAPGRWTFRGAPRRRGTGARAAQARPRRSRRRRRRRIRRASRSARARRQRPTRRPPPA